MLSLRSIIIYVFILSAGFVTAQAGALKGKVLDNESNEVLMLANVVIYKNGVMIKGVATDYDGNYSIKPLDPGSYDVEFSYFGYQKKILSGVTVASDQVKTLNARLSELTITTDVVTKIAYKEPLVQKDEKNVTTKEELNTLATMSAQDAAGLQGGAMQKDDGEAVSAMGARTDANDTYINGVKVVGVSSLPKNSIEQITVINGGVPARYGDATGMIINITTRGISNRYFGGIEILSSQLTDPYGYNLVEGSLGGPLSWRKEVAKNKAGESIKATDGTDSIKKVAPNFGFLLSGRLSHQLDQDPSAVGIWKISDAKYQELIETPIVVSPSGEGYQMAANFYRLSDFENQAIKDNNQAMDVNLVTNFEIKPNDDYKLAFGGRYNYRKRDQWFRSFSLMNYDNMPERQFHTGSGFAKITQWLISDKNQDQVDQKDDVKPFITNAYYSLQVDFSRDYREIYHKRHGFNPFDYGAIGQFESDWTRNMEDLFIDENGLLTAARAGEKNTRYTADSKNPTLSNYTSTYYDLLGENPDGVDFISSRGGLINGSTPQNVLGIWANVGEQSNSFSKFNQDQYRGTLIANVDLNFKVKTVSKDNKFKNVYYPHSIEFGGEFEQRELSSYGFSDANQLWGRMRLLTNAHISQDTDNPLFGTLNIEGFNVPNVQYYNDKADIDAQYSFDRNLRTKLGLDPDGTDHIQIHNQSADFYSLDMFTAEELIQQGSNSLVTYYGYDYLGNKMTTKVSFGDYWTAQDENGNNTRPINSYSPIYAAFFVQDKFSVDKLFFNVGVRVDRFDANQKVLIDKYSLYGMHTAGDIVAAGFDDLPDNIQESYKVYVKDIESSIDDIDDVSVAGYRNEDTWYDADGVEVSNPEVIAELSKTGTITPFLIDPNDNIQESTYDHGSAFKDYVPYLSVMPRILFNFELKENAMFFAHYDVLTQRPSSGYLATPFDYMFMRELNNIQTFSNPDLTPQQTIDYSVGFKQALGAYSAIKIKGFYREMRNMINMTRINYAYPISYTTFGNIDFSTVKGMTATFDQRSKGNLRMKVDYTLQFADGTGSSATSASGILASDQPNLRTIFPLAFDQRHTIITNLDYRFGEGSEYRGPSRKKYVPNGDFMDTIRKPLFQNIGLNLVLRMGSGTPYSRQTQPTPDASFNSSRSSLLGSMNGSRLPWSTKVDVKIDKKFRVFKEKTSDGSYKPRTGLQCQIYLQVLNLFDTRNIMAVYSFTGNAQDDGYLSSTLGQEAVSALEVQGTDLSYIDYYNMSVVNPNYFSLPRRTRIGLVVNF
jgi:hypothetical protein